MPSQREIAYNKIRDAITYGEFKPGERLVELELCKKYTMGRTPIREAIHQLQAEGYIDLFHNKGAIITRYSVEDLESIFDIVAVLESYATEAAVRRLGPSEKLQLRSMAEDIKKVTDRHDYKKWLEKNALFHGYFVRLTGNPYLGAEINSLRGRIYRYRIITLTIPGQIEEFIRAHDEILEFVMKGDAVRAGKAMRRHILKNKDGLIKFLRQSPGL